METEDQEGGKLLGYGVSGCAFMPPLLCKGETKPKNKLLVTKIGVKADLMDDFAKLKYISDNVPLAETYFVITKDTKLCEPSKKQVEPQSSIDKCFAEADALSSYSLGSLRLLRMNYGGVPMRDPGAIGPQTNIWDFGKHLLEGLTLLMVNGIVHADLHSNNVVVKGGLPRIIDFGNSFFMRTNRDMNRKLRGQLESYFHRPVYTLENATRYTQEPPEGPLFNGFFEGIPTNKILEGIFKYRNRFITNLHAILGITKGTIVKQITDYRSKTKYFERDPNLEEWWKLHWHTYDAWGAGYLLLSVIADLSIAGVDFERSSMYKGKFNKMKEALRGLLNFNCIKRLDAAGALAIWDSPNNPILKKYAADW